MNPGLKPAERSVRQPQGVHVEFLSISASILPMRISDTGACGGSTILELQIERNRQKDQNVLI